MDQFTCDTWYSVMEPPSKKFKQSTLLNFFSTSNSCLIDQCDSDQTQDHEVEEQQEPDDCEEGDHVEVLPAASNLISENCENEPPCSSTTSFQPQVL